MKYRLLRFSLLCMLVMLCGGSMWADDVTLASGTFDGKNGNYTTGWSTTGTGTGRTDCIIIGTGENITSPSLNLSQYSKVTISIKARRYGTLSGSKATIDASIGGISVGTTDATGTNATTAITDIEFTPTKSMTAAAIVFTCTNATSAGSTHGAGINSIVITGTTASGGNLTKTTIVFGEYQTNGQVGGSMPLPTVTLKTVDDNDNITGTIATPDPAITWESSNTTVASISGSNISFVGAGKTNITASYAGNTTEYKPSSNSFELTISSAVQDGVFDFTTGLDYGSGDTPNNNNSAENNKTWTAGNIIMTLAGKNCWWDNNGTYDLRLYAASGELAAGSMTFTAPTGKVITKIVFTGSSVGSNLTTENGTYKSGTWTGSSNPVTITSSGGSTKINTITVTYGDAPTIIVAEPTFSPAGGNYEEAKAVTLTCTTEGATIYYSTDNENFSAYTGPINVSETTTLYAYSQVGEEKSATVSATYNIVIPITTASALNAAAIEGGKDGKPVTYNFTNAKVVYVNGSYNYIADETGYALLYKNNLGLTAGKVITGTLTGTAKTYSGLPEIAVTSIEVTSSADDTDVPAPTTISIDELANNVNNYIKVENAEYVSASSKTLTFKVGETNLTVYNQFGLSTTGLTAGKIYNITGFGSINNSNNQIYPTEITEVIIAPAEFQDFEAIVNNQTGTLLTTDEQVQGTAVSFGIAVDTEGKTTRVAADDASAIATISGTYHSDHGLTNMKVVTAVPGAVKILVGKCTYATTKITVTNSDGQTVAEYTPQGEQGSGDLVCWKNDHSNVMELVYTGEATTLTITGMQYCPFIAVKKYVAPAEFQDFEAIVNNQTGTLLTTDEQVQGTAVSFGIAVDTEGKTTRVAADNASSIATISGVYHSDHGLTNMKVVTPVPGAVKILVGKCTYATTKITVTNSDGQTVAEYTPQGEQGSGDLVCWKNDHSNVMELTYTGEATTLTITGMKYCPFIAVKKIIETGPVTLDNEEATATFPFNLGTEGQKATFSNADYWLNSKVVLGSNNSYKGTTTISNTTMTLIEPTAQLQNADETGTIRFRINPKPGFTFTPNKVSLKASKVGTDNGKINVAWENPDKTTISLATEIAPTRNNSGLSSLEYNIEGATAGEGACGVVVSLYGLQNGKQMAFSDIVIEGTLSGTEKDVPVLATFTINNKEYQVEEVFGDEYEATLKLSKAEAMVSSTNAVTATATNGTIGTITYENATEEGCKVTIPVTADETTLNYVLNVIQKPDYTLTYYAVDGTTVLDTDTREEDQAIGDFKVNIADVEASMDGYKARGWFKQNNVGAKYKTTDVVTSNLNLYAVETEIEVSSDFKKYEYDLTDVNFDANDHEAFNPTGIARWHDKQHGWEFKNGDKIDLLVGPKANIIFTLCQHSAAGSTITWDTENSISAVGESDAAIETIAYEGEAGTLSLTINTSNTVYIHRIKIVNTTTTNYTQDGQWIFVKPGDASSFLDALDAANATDGEENVFIFLPNGTYDLGHKTKTSIGRNNISIIGNSMDEVIIKNAPTTEGIDVTATLLNTSSNLYMQDLTIECDAPWIGNAERGVTLQDKGNQTILKNVYLKGKQDTYYSNNPDGTFYFENGMIQGSVDYVCGYGDVYFNNTSFYTVNKSTGGKGGCIAAPNTLKSFGYIFNSCILDGQENENGLYRLARPWGADTKCFFVNTIMVIQPNAAGWGEWSSPKNAVTQFAEYNSVDGSGTPIDLTGRATTIGDQPNNPWLTEAEAAALTPNAIFNGDWKPQVIATQLNPPSGKLKDGTITWDAVKDAIAYAIYDGDELLGITTGTSWTIENVTSAPRHAQGTYSSYSLRSANSRGGFGEAVLVSYATGIDATLNDNEETTNEKVIYDLNGRRVLTPTKGVYIINGKKVVIK